ncbi:MAG: glucosamine-6-phosphate deaminase [Bacilli bacterium]
MKIRVFDSQYEAGSYAALLAERTILAKESPVLGLATGATSIPFYSALVQRRHNGLDFSRVTTVNLDELVGVGADDPRSYHYFMQHQLFSRVNILPENAHVPDGLAIDAGAECVRYDRVIDAHTPDLQILGIGGNGHIGFNEPGDALLARTHVVRLHQETVAANARAFPSWDGYPSRAITVGVTDIFRAARIVLMAFGEEKADIVARAIKDPITTHIPASLLRLHADVTVVLDRASAGRLSPAIMTRIDPKDGWLTEIDI